MQLTDFDKKKHATKALAENYRLSFDPNKLNKVETLRMLKKVRSLVSEAKQAKDFYQNQNSQPYMKLVFMEQALSDHYKNLAKKSSARIVFENEEVEKSQVVLAAQDMCDTIQKMLEEIGEMQVKELPALVDSIESEIGVNEAQRYDEMVSEQLNTLSEQLKTSFTQFKQARDMITGQEGSFTEPAGGEETGAELGAELGAEAGAEMGAEAGAELGAEAGVGEVPELPAPEEPEDETGTVGRAKR